MRGLSEAYEENTGKISGNISILQGCKGNSKYNTSEMGKILYC